MQNIRQKESFYLKFFATADATTVTPLLVPYFFINSCNKTIFLHSCSLEQQNSGFTAETLNHTS